MLLQYRRIPDITLQATFVSSSESMLLNSFIISYRLLSGLFISPSCFFSCSLLLSLPLLLLCLPPLLLRSLVLLCFLPLLLRSLLLLFNLL